MKINKLLLALLFIVPLLSACLDDISDLDDPRDAIAKLWRVTESAQSYDVTISKDANESTRVLFTNFHNLGTSNKLYATLAGNTLTIPQQTLDGTYAISGSGTIANDLKSITFNYSVKEGADPAEDFVAEFGQVITTKKKVAKPAL